MKLHREYMRKYKKNTIALLLSMAMTIALVVCLLTVTNTDNHLKSLTTQYIWGAYDIGFKALTKEQIKDISSNKDLKYVEFSRFIYTGQGAEKQRFSVFAANKDNILERTRLLKGRMPQNKHEIVAEVWALENLGVKPKLNSELKVKVIGPEDNSESDWKLKKYRVVGIISDNATNKTDGLISIYTKFKGDYKDAELLVKYKNGVDIKKAGEGIKNKFNLKGKQIHYNYGVLDYDYYKSQLSKTNAMISLLLLCICAIVIGGVYRISLMNRMEQYGILKAVGMQKKQIRKLIGAELYQIYLISIPVGVCVGFLVAYLLNILTRDKTQTLVFWGEKYKIPLDIPTMQIMLCILGVGLIVGVIVFITSRMINKNTAIAIIHGEVERRNKTKYAFMTKAFAKSEKPYLAIALKYVFHDIKSTIFVVLSLSVGACLFIGLFYQAGLDNTINIYDKQKNFYNGDFKLEESQNDDLLTTGLSKNVLRDIKKIEGVKGINTQRVLPVRVIDDKKVSRNKPYFDFFNGAAKKYYPFKSYNGNDGTDSFYLTELRGYNESALRKLHKYILEGDYNPQHLDSNSIIMFMPKTIGKNDWRRPQNYPKSGYYVMNYKVGDKLTFKYRKDFKTNTKDYYLFKDKTSKYIYKKYKIGAIVYYPYLDHSYCMSYAYPILIVSEPQMKRIAPKEVFTSISLNVDKSKGEEYLKDVDDRLVGLAIRNGRATARSIIDQTRDMDNLYRKQLIYSYGIAFVVILLAAINIVNNLKYRISIRKKDISIYRAIGIRHNMIRKMILFENMILGTISCLITCIASFLITGVLYQRSDSSYYRVGWHNDMRMLMVVCVLILVICNLISKVITKKLSKNNIVININSVE